MWWFSKKQPQPVAKKTAIPVLFLPSVAPEWTTLDISNLRQFLLTPTGQSLIKRWDAACLDVAKRANKDTITTTHSAGHSVGFNEAMQWVLSLASQQMLEKLSAPEAVKSENIQQPGTYEDSDLLTRFSP